MAINKNDKKIDKIKDRINKILYKLNKKDMDGIASFIERMVRVRTRLGFGVKRESGEKYKLKELKGRPNAMLNTVSRVFTGKSLKVGSTIYQRELMKKRGELSNLTTPMKSNLTMTGQLLDSIKWKIDKLTITLFFDSNRRKDGRNTNNEIANYVSEKRPFFNLSKQEIEQVKREVIKVLKSRLKS
jgi:hypothetical protein